MPPEGQSGSCLATGGSGVPLFDMDRRRVNQIESVQYQEADLQVSPIDVPWGRKWSPLSSLEVIPPSERKEWMLTRNEDILELIDRAAVRAPDKAVITWLGEKGKAEVTYTYDQVYRKSHAVAQKLLQKWGLKSGDHVILVYPPGPEFIIAFLGCMRAGGRSRVL
jgi:non-ribosomal peptide synthetase component F